MAAPTTNQYRKLVDALEAGGLSPLLVKVLRDNLPKLDSGAVSQDEFALLLRRLAGDDLDKALAACGGAAPPPVTRVRLSSLVHDFRFLFDGQCICSSFTPADIGLQNGDTIDAMPVQFGD